VDATPRAKRFIERGHQEARATYAAASRPLPPDPESIDMKSSLFLGLFLAVTASATSALGGDRVFVPSATLEADHTVSLPLHEGRVGSRVVWYVVTDASTGDAADRWRSNRSQKLENARRAPGSLQNAAFGSDGLLHFDATVDFRPERVIVPTPGVGFPPLDAQPGAIAEDGYSPLVRLSDGTILNAPHLANDTGRADKVVELDTKRGRVRYELTDGRSRKNSVVYISTESSDPGAAAIENVTFAPRLNAAPFAGGDGTDSARASLGAFVNGPTGVDNPQRQGLNSALLGEGDPLNVLAWMPNQGRYSPLWDVHLTAWAEPARARRLTEFAAIEDGADDGKLTGPDGERWGPSGFVVNCPIIAQVGN